MSEHEERYKVRIHFPYAQVVLNENQERWQVDRIKTAHQDGANYIVSNGDTQYYINPALVTYVEITEVIPFGG